MAGILYVVFNKWINNPETQKNPYKIGITGGSVEDRYYGLGLKMPGEFETLFAYLIEDYKQAETYLQNIFKQYRINGEWFDLKQEQLDLIKNTCKIGMGGIDVKDKVKIEQDPIKKYRKGNGDPLPGNDIFTDALNELKKVAGFLKEKDNYDIRTRNTPFGNNCYCSCTVIGRPTHGIAFIISICPKRPLGHKYKYGFTYETDHEADYKLKEKQKIIEEKYKGISEFKETAHKGKILFSLKGEDIGNEVLDIIDKTHGIIGF
jgi:hypothetical protein